MAQVVMALEPPLGYVIAEGAPPVSFLRQGMQSQQVRLLGQLLPGLSGAAGCSTPALAGCQWSRSPAIWGTSTCRCWQLLKQSGADGEQLHRVQHWWSIGAEMLANLKAATDVGAGDQLRSSAG